MVQYSDTELLEIIIVATESLYNGKILTILNELEKSFPEIVKEYSITKNTKCNPESVEELMLKKNSINNIIFYSKIKLYENKIIRNTTKEKEKIYLQDPYEALKGYCDVLQNITHIMDLSYSRNELELKYNGVIKGREMYKKYLEYFKDEIGIFDSEKIEKALHQPAVITKYNDMVKKHSDQIEYLRINTTKKSVEFEEYLALLNKTYINVNLITIPIMDSSIDFEYTLN
ncbi:MAG: hypothetical protein ACP5N1_02945 [Candidatus Woesearchaeota archaeon]